MARFYSALLLFLLLLLPSAHAEAIFRRSMDRFSSMDPALSSSLYSSRAVMLVYETLLDVDYYARPYKLIPSLASELPTCSADHRTYTIYLNPQARFQSDPCFGLDSNGKPQSRPVTAQDVVFSLKRLADAKVSSPGSWLVEGSIVGLPLFQEASKSDKPTDYSMPVEGLKVIDDRTVQITLVRPMYQFVWYLSMPYTAIVPKEATTFYGSEFGIHAVGSGPYCLTEWRRNHQVLYSRNRSWIGWKQGPAAIDPDSNLIPFEKISYRVMDDVSTQWLCFLAGEIDFLGEISQDNWDVVIDGAGGLSNDLKKRGFTLHSIPALEVAYIGINMEDPVLGKNKALRQALNCAFDSDAYIRFLNHRITRCNGPVPPGTAGRLEDPLPYATNLEKARELLKKAGYPEGIDPNTGRRLELTLDIGRTSQEMRETSELMASFYAKVGISLIPSYHNWPTFLRRIARHQSQMFRIGWIGDYPDAENFLQLFYGKNLAPGPNRCNYSNPVFDKTYEVACNETDEKKRNELWIQAQRIVREDCPWIFIHFRKAYSLCGPRMKNFVASDFPHGTEKYLRVEKRTQIKKLKDERYEFRKN